MDYYTMTKDQQLLPCPEWKCIISIIFFIHSKTGRKRQKPNAKNKSRPRHRGYITFRNEDDQYHNEDDQYHNENGPAIICIDGFKAWMINSKPHNLKGPAFIWPDGKVKYYINGENLSKEEWHKYRVL